MMMEPLRGSVYVLPTCSAMTDDNSSQSHEMVDLSAGWYLDEKFSSFSGSLISFEYAALLFFSFLFFNKP